MRWMTWSAVGSTPAKPNRRATCSRSRARMIRISVSMAEASAWQVPASRLALCQRARRALLLCGSQGRSSQSIALSSWERDAAHRDIMKRA